MARPSSDWSRSCSFTSRVSRTDSDERGRSSLAKVSERPAEKHAKSIGDTAHHENDRDSSQRNTSKAHKRYEIGAHHKPVHGHERDNERDENDGTGVHLKDAEAFIAASC